MANITIVEDQQPLAQPTKINTHALLQRFFQRFGYKQFRPSATFCYLARIVPFERYAICDILIYGISDDMDHAETLVPQLDAHCKGLHHDITLGKPIVRQLQVCKHHFMKLQKQYKAISYQTRENLPVGFLIRPLIVLQKVGHWDYLNGPSKRIDVISYDLQFLEFYMQRHQDYLETRSSKHVNLKKFAYPRIANWLIDYGHYPLIVLWLVDLLCAISQIPFPFSLTSMVLLTALVYSSYLGVTFVLHKQFKKRQFSELDANTPSLPSPIQSSPFIGSSPFRASPPEIAYSTPQLDPSIPQATPEDLDPLRISYSEEDLMKIVSQETFLLLKLHEIKVFAARAKRLMRLIFALILIQSSQNFPEGAELPELFKRVRQDSRISEIANVLKIWVRKLHTNTPFSPNELPKFKKFLLDFLYPLRLLPRELEMTVEGKITKAQVISAPESPPISVEAVPVAAHAQQPAEEQLTSERVTPLNSGNTQLCATFAEPSQKRCEPSASIDPEPNLDVATVPQTFHAEIAGLNAKFLRQMQNEPKSGVYCTILLNESDPATQQTHDSFLACTLDLDVNPTHILKSALDHDAFLKEQFRGHDAPAVMVGLGDNFKVIPFGQKGDDTLLHTLIDEYLRLYNSDTTPRIVFREKSPPNNNEPPQDQISTNLPTDNLEFQSSNSSRAPADIDLALQLNEFAPGSVMLDGNNICFLTKDFKITSGPSLNVIFQLVDSLVALGIPRPLIAIYFDASFRSKLKEVKNFMDLNQYVKYVDQNIIREVPSRTEADAAFVQGGKKLGQFVVVSNDHFSEMDETFQKHRLGVGLLTPDNTPYLGIKTNEELINAFYGRDPLPKKRSEKTPERRVD